MNLKGGCESKTLPFPDLASMPDERALDLRKETKVDDLSAQPELALVLGEALLLLRRGEQRDGVALSPLARRAARDVHVRVEARGQAKHEDHVAAGP